ncbi:uncharacterized protein [Halyomorpha halys]|uniref:uncharacterized protein n=1 Tax=Halyomorpha halys TaxID=286706 RepID=UPI0006D52661|nr:uncharacterized protein LOC106677936 [Halyomorpha halys]
MGVAESDVNGFVLASLLLSHCCSVLAILDRKGVYVEDEPRRHYRLEDFLWSGSGDGDGSGDSEATWATTTIYRTTTVLTTIYPTPVLPGPCPGDECHISPTPTIFVPGPSVTLPPPPVYPDVPDQRYWLVTVIEANNTAVDLSPSVFEQRLARLYRAAFHRQQEKHLKLNSNNEREKKTVSRERRETVSVRVLRVRKNSQGGLVLVYTVRVAGKPVDANVAAQDMKLLADHEVSTLLGFNVLTKAEPFLKQTEAAPGQRDLWLIIGASATAIILILVLIIVLLLFIGKKKRKRSGTRSRTSFLQKEKTTGRENMGFQDDVDSTKEEDTNSGTMDEGSARKGVTTPGRQPVPSPRPRPRSYKPSTPNSYLSMPSIKAFPRGAAKPGPLEDVLESTVSRSGALSRHSSESADPGVVGPLVWDLHCHRLNKKGENEESPNADLSVGRMRRRFHELLDDAFSLFGSGSASPDEGETSNTTNYGRAKSAVVLPVDPLTSDQILRPKTTDACRPSTAGVSRMPRGAWGATPPSSPPKSAPLRPLSAGPFHTPTLEPAWILTDAALKSTDPAVPLIKAIKSELDKFPYAMPGSYQT